LRVLGLGLTRQQLQAPGTPSSLNIPGAWPQSLEHEDGVATPQPACAFLSTIGTWATSVLCLPGVLVQRFFRKEHVLVQPIVREDGARKKRILDVSPSFAPETPTPAPGARKLTKHRGRGPASPVLSSPINFMGLGQGIRNKVAEDVEMRENILEASSDFDGDVEMDGFSSDVYEDIGMDGSSLDFDEDVGLDEPEDGDVSLDISFDNCITSPIHRDDPVRLRKASPSPSPQKASAPAPAPAPAPALTLAVTHGVKDPNQLSPNTHYNIIRKATVTPARKSLLKLQVLAQGGKFTHKPTTPVPNHTVPISEPPIKEPTELQHKEIHAAPLKKNAAIVAQEAHQGSEACKAQAEARQNNIADISPDNLLGFNYAETIDQELSFLSDAPDYDEAAQTLHSPILSPAKNRSVRWSSHANAKSFYCDDRVADMLDSTLETIMSSPFRASISEETPEEDASGDESQSSVQDAATSNESDGFEGVPASTWDDSDDSLVELEMSSELLLDLQQDMQTKLALAPPPPPPPPVADLITPLSSEEQDVLDAAIKKTDSGKVPDMFVVDEKLQAKDFATLLPRQFNGDPRAWLNDNIVNDYLSILTAAVKNKAGFVPKKDGPAPPVHAFSSFWYTTCKDNAAGVARWAKRFHLAGKNYLDAELILYPICDNHHWRLLAVKPQERTIEYVDSLGWGGNKYVDKLKEVLAMELKGLWKEDEWTVLQKQRSTRQLNASDCGVFTVLNALALLRGEEFTKVLACDGMPEARERIATTLMAGVPTTELD
jgi:hypothetical protein